ncbi:pyruvate/2-oxoglutarate dehydrogenase complex dihydrolipoamide acyltransferase (E2) component [Xanthomonas translucens]
MSASSNVLAFPALVLVAIGLSGCFARKQDNLVKETFNSDNTYSRSYPVQPGQACESARRALLSQGYVVAKATADTVEGTKNFQPNQESHEQLELRVSCVAHGQDESWVFVSALQDRYALKKSATSASVGVGVLGSVSLPVGSSDDSLVRVASSTVQDGDFYKRFFELMAQYLPKAKPAAPPEPPKPEPAAAAPAPATAPVPAPAAEPATAPAPVSPTPVAEAAPAPAAAPALDDGTTPR